MKRKFLLRMLGLWIVILLPGWVGAEDLGALRLSQMAGDVQIQSKGSDEWFPATINFPVQAGDRLWSPKDAWIQVETREGSVIRLDADSSIDIVAVEKDSLQVYLSQGQAYVNFRKGRGAMLQLDTPDSSLRVYDNSTFNVDLVDNGNTEISVYRGSVFAENKSGEIAVDAGRMLLIDNGLPALMALDAPNEWEQWNRDWDASLIDNDDSERYLPQELSGYGSDLSRNGRWVETGEYGNVWIPTTHVSDDWAPYREGRWVWVGDDYVWIASEPWGWAPYHYGRWAFVSSYGWCWVPPPRNEVYWAPGYVSWVATDNDIAWVPLAPSETYYGHGYYGPHSVNIVNFDIHTVVPGKNYRNVHVRNAVTIVNRDTFLTGRHHEVGHRENPFLQKSVNIGRPRIEPGRMAKMPVIKNIPKSNAPPAHIQSLPSRTVEGSRPMVRERDRSVFKPTAAPHSLTPTDRMRPERTEKQLERQKAPGSAGRKGLPEPNVMPGQLKGRPNADTDAVKSATPPPANVRPQGAPPARVQGPPPSRREEQNAPAVHERPQLPEHNVMPGQLRGRPNVDPEAVRPAPAPAPARQQMAPPPPPAPVQAPPPAQHVRPPQDKDKKDEPQEEPERRGMRPR